MFQDIIYHICRTLETFCFAESMYLSGVLDHALIVLLSRKRPLLQGLTVTQYIHSLFLLHFLVAAEIRIMIGSTNNSIQIILFLLSVDPEVGVIA